MRAQFTLAVLAATALLAAASAHEPGQTYDAQTDAWFRSLQNQRGFPCCDNSDAHRVEDVDWESTPEGYRVRIDGEWMDVPPEAVITSRNHVGYALVWFYHTRLVCFLPGSGV